ncbi:DUF4097 family beta strand repeat-containing protein [Prauserella muralis]|uniref:DUF4097 domain-containing protein n=1 Tax=Prauserella muralis TaxID=588067 RepID=A0A2V4AHK8_9PSEU|nr:DUF4097 family beta strand repeat-containing protein [Prauserella muralis]PXY19395.1 hypothetical protein BAY60_32120 [Prauserella muralis]TWE29364.1 putative adhesin [Prauserella muralis]
MPRFDTPEPILVTLDLSVANVRFVASERTDTVVEVRPTNENEPSDVKAAKQIRVEYSGGTLLIKGKNPRPFEALSTKSWSVDVTVDLPEGSQVHADASVGEFQSAGRLGECRFKSSAGHARLDRTGPLRLNTSAGHVSVEGVAGDAEVTTGTGRIRIGEIRGGAVIKNSNGSTDVGTIGGEVRVRSANGDIAVDRAGRGVNAKTANGAIRVGEVTRGSVVLETSTGDLEIGIGEGTSAWLDVKTNFGQVRNALDETAEPPERTGETVEVRAHTGFGDITIHRASRLGASSEGNLR